ncbi:MAG: PAS domain S-box protein [Acidobacteria bacterium]|nr:PAS domain S-box protein [Acidobacteriota bacterium]
MHEVIWKGLEHSKSKHPSISASQVADAERLADILNIADDAIISTDEEQNITFFNQGAEKIFGYVASDVIGKPLDLLLTVRFAEVHRRHVEQFASAPETARKMGERREISGRRKDGTEFPAEASISKLESKGGKIFTVILRDISERKQAEQERSQLAQEQMAWAAAEQRAELMRRLQLVTDATFSNLTRETLVPELLNRIRSVVGADMAAILLLNEDQQTLTPVGVLGLEEASSGAIRVGEGFAGKIAQQQESLAISDPREIESRYPGFSQRGIRSALGAPLMVEGRLIGVVEVCTNQKRMFTSEDEQLLKLVADRIAQALEYARLYHSEQEARLAAEEANRAKDQFLAVLSHELRTPLTPIIGWSNLLRDPQRKLSVQTGLDVIDRNARLLARLIEDLLTLSSSRFGQLHLQEDEADLSVLLSQCLDSISESMRQKQLELALNLPDAPVVMRADRGRLMQALGNILNNAVKFTGPGGLISVTLCRQDRRAVITVQDTGTGIAPEFLPYLFEPFRQADFSTARKHGGLGLGLSITRQIIHAHGGTIRAESSGTGTGSTFIIDLPL